MSCTCNICNRDDRIEIEQALLSMSPESNIDIEAIASQYDLSVEDLKTHALFHTPAIGHEAFEKDTPKESLTRKMKLREADILDAVTNEYLTTLKAMGRRIHKIVGVSSIDAEDQDKQVTMARLLTKPAVDMYIGLGNEIRQNVKAMAELDKALNGPADTTGQGLAALAAAISGSRE